MSLYGSLYSGVSGLKGQANKIGVISDNISNVNTVGYKGASAQFQTLVTGSGGTLAYSPGGVLGSSRQIIDKQGLIQATDAPTDIAVSGAGLFVVSDKATSDGRILYTRAGSFRQDNLGNLVNASGFYLRGWPLDKEGRLPGEPGNLNTTSSANPDSLETVNVASTNGVAAATTTVDVGVNLDAGEEVYPGAGVDINMNVASLNNYGIKSTDIIVSNNYGAAPVNGIVRGDQLTVTTGNGLSYTYNYGGFVVSRDVTSGVAGDGGTAVAAPGVGNILDATTPTQALLGTTGLAGFTTAARSFTITTATSGTVTFTYVSSSPNATSGQFNSLSTLAAAIDQANGLSARVVNNRLYIAPENADEAMTFANGDSVGTVAPPLAGINWVAELDLTNTVAGTNRYATLQGLADKVNASSGLSATVTNPLSQSSLRIFNDDPLDTISYFDGPDTNLAVTTNTGSLIREFGLATHPQFVNGAGVEEAVQGVGPAYDSTGSVGNNLASGNIVAQFSRNVRVYDALGTGHDLRMSFIKTGINVWAVEVHALPDTDVSTTLVNGQVATGTITFNGDGSLRSLSSSLSSPITVNWTNGAVPSNIAINWGTAGQPFGTTGATTIGLTDGLSQFDSDYNVAFLNQNGNPVGDLTGITIDRDGNVSANYSNGQTQKVYRLPLADFNNPNGLETITGNVFSQTQESGEVNLREARKNGVGSIEAGALEAANVELADQLTDMIVAQRAYQANTRVISTTDDLLEALNQL